MVINAVLQLMGSFIISFAFNWKIALVSTFVSIPLGFVCAYFRYRYEIGFEKMSAAVSVSFFFSFIFSKYTANPKHITEGLCRIFPMGR